MLKLLFTQSHLVKVMIFESGGYDIEPIKAGPGNSASTIVLNKTEEGEKFTYKEDPTGKTMEVYNGENVVINSYKILKKGKMESYYPIQRGYKGSLKKRLYGALLLSSL